MGDLRKIPGVGQKIEQNLMDLGYCKVEDLAGQNPEEIYMRDCVLRARELDRCLLYVYRCAVYYASTPESGRQPDKLLWWNHMD